MKMFIAIALSALFSVHGAPGYSGYPRVPGYPKIPGGISGARANLTTVLKLKDVGGNGTAMNGGRGAGGSMADCTTNQYFRRDIRPFTAVCTETTIGHAIRNCNGMIIPLTASLLQTAPKVQGQTVVDGAGGNYTFTRGEGPLQSD
jgi:hypothetical protein